MKYIESSLVAPSCEICFTDYQNNEKSFPVVLPCGHTWCNNCFKQIEKSICPCCRIPFQPSFASKNYVLAEVSQNVNEELVRQKKVKQDFEDLQQENRNLREIIQRMEQEKQEALVKMNAMKKAIQDAELEKKVSEIWTELNTVKHLSEQCKYDAIHNRTREMLIDFDNTQELSEPYNSNKFEIQQIRKDYLQQLQHRVFVETDQGLVKLSSREISKLTPYFSRMSYRELLLYTELDVMSEKKFMELQKFCHEMSNAIAFKKRFMTNSSFV